MNPFYGNQSPGSYNNAQSEIVAYNPYCPNHNSGGDFNGYSSPAATNEEYYNPYFNANGASNDVVNQHLQLHDDAVAASNTAIQNIASAAAREAARVAGVVDDHSAPMPDFATAGESTASLEMGERDTLEGTAHSLTNIEDADRKSKKDAAIRAKRTVSGGHPEVSVEQQKRLQEVDSISHRWRVRAIYDDIGTAAPAAPDALATFLKLRADMLRPSTEVVRLKEARKREEKEAKRVAAIEKRKAERAQARERRLRHAPGGGTASLERQNTFASARNLGNARHESQISIGGGSQQSGNGGAQAGTNLSASDESDDEQPDDGSDNENEYDEGFLKAELHRVLEQLQKAHSDAQNLQAQNNVMSKELRVRQKKINELEDWNRDLLEQNRELERTVHDLRSAAIDDDQLQQQQQNDHLQVPGTRRRLGSKPPIKMSRNVSQRSHISQ